MNQGTEHKRGPRPSALHRQLFQDVAVAVPAPARWEPASVGARLEAFLIDYMLWLLGATAAIWVGSLMTPHLSLVALTLSVVGGVGVVFIVNHLVVAGLRGQTVGKMMRGIKVVGASGRPPSWSRLLGRSMLGYLLSVAPLGLGLIWILWDSEQQAWHDKLFSTYVVKVNGHETDH